MSQGLEEVVGDIAVKYNYDILKKKVTQMAT